MNNSLRGKGLGRILWNRLDALWKANNVTVAGLDGVANLVQAYERRGFVDVGLIHVLSRPSLKGEPLPSKAPSPLAGETIKDIRSVDAKLLRDLDLTNTGIDRPALWTEKALFSRSDAYGYAVLSDTDALLGYILVRRCQEGHRFGPLYAQTYQQAQLLLHTAMNHVPQSDGTLTVEIFGDNPLGQQVFQELGWEHTGVDYHRMWLGGRVPEAQQVYGQGRKTMFAIFDASQG